MRQQFGPFVCPRVRVTSVILGVPPTYLNRSAVLFQATILNIYMTMLYPAVLGLKEWPGNKLLSHYEIMRAFPISGSGLGPGILSASCIIRRNLILK
ncbi:hypothetical protein L798_01561 [Zootermopsis nevadensis]|uniref:Uncharacterized protein n=1 Tax=Zootermopsis nevadensis TaxID=136037 RepID=A0A067RF79_ZOONE|nr:hypothetical protein L798_01561 [Zootermopsis nevadensis]